MKRLITCLAAWGLLFGLPLNADARRAPSRELEGSIQNVDRERRLIEFTSEDGNTEGFKWREDTRFISGNQFTNAAVLQEHQHATVYYRAPLIGEKFVTKVVVQTHENQKH